MEIVAYDPARAALALLCVLVVAFAASLFPATGFGAYPTGTGSGGPIDSSLDSPGITDPDAVDSGPSSADDTPTAAPQTATPTTQTETPDESNSTSVGDGGDGGGGGDIVVAIVGAGFVVLVGFAGFLLVPLGSNTNLSIAGVELPALQSRLRSIVGAIPRRTMTFVVGLSASVPGLLDSLGSTLAQVGSGLGTVASGLASAVANSARLLTAGLGGLFVTLPRAFGGLFSVFDGLSRTGGSFRRRSSDDADDATSVASPPVGGDEDDGPRLPRSVEEAWTAMVELVPIRDRRSTTPGEYARAAIDAGLPATPVQRLTALFEETRYGDRPSTADRVQSARAALRSILDRGEDR